MMGNLLIIEDTIKHGVEIELVRLLKCTNPAIIIESLLSLGNMALGNDYMTH